MHLNYSPVTELHGATYLKETKTFPPSFLKSSKLFFSEVKSSIVHKTNDCKNFNSVTEILSAKKKII